MRDIIGRIPFWFDSEDNSTALYSSARISRNFKTFSFPSAPEYKNTTRIQKKVENILKEPLDSGEIVKCDISRADNSKISWMQKFRILPVKEKDLLKRTSIYYHTGFRSFLLTNYLDHLTFFSHRSAKKVSAAYTDCKKFLEMFDDSIMLKDGSGNYQTSSIDYFGTGLKLFCVLTLPVLRIMNIFEPVVGSLGVNSLLTSRYFGVGKNDMIVISNKDSFTKKPAGIVRFFNRILKELDLTVKKNTKKEPQQSEVIRKRSLELINSRYLTFSEFIDIYYMLSFLGHSGACPISISDLNRELAQMILNSPKGVSAASLKRILTEEFKVKMIKLLTEER
ncbi:MAG: hypothetical protein R6V47_06755 [Candidatus Delongbacteria bacterium]